MNELYLDKLRVEKERGITVKAQTATMFFKYLDGETYILNLIDTPVRDPLGFMHLPHCTSHLHSRSI